MVADLVRGAERVATSIVSYAECRAAIAAAVRSRRMLSREARKAVDILNQLWPSFDRVSALEDLVQHAGGLAERRALRGFDAIHLASAIALGSGVVLASWDRDLLRAARTERLAIAPRSALINKRRQATRG